jgi:hypothetical protein
VVQAQVLPHLESLTTVRPAAAALWTATVMAYALVMLSVPIYGLIKNSRD